MQTSFNKFNEDSSLIARGVYKETTVEIYLKSILSLEAQAVVNAANKRLEHIGGLAAQIAYEAGEEFIQACKSHKKEVTLSTPFVTDAFHLRNKKFEKIFNVVGPIVENGYQASYHNKQLTDCLIKLLETAEKQGITSIAIPAISCGIFGFPIQPGAFCHMAAFFQFADDRARKSKYLQIIKFGLFQEGEALEFGKEFLNKLSKFDSFDFFDLPRNRSGPFTKYCGGCSSIFDLEYFSELSCNCKIYCNFCVSRYNLELCLNCKVRPDYINITNSIWCRECNEKIFLTKKMKSRICRNCRNTCFLHYKPGKPCSYCREPYRETLPSHGN